MNLWQATFRLLWTQLSSCKCSLICTNLILDEAISSQATVCSNLKIATIIYPQNRYCQAIITHYIISNVLAFNQLYSLRSALTIKSKNFDQMPYSLSKIARLPMLQFSCPVEIPTWSNFPSDRGFCPSPRSDNAILHVMLIWLYDTTI